MKKLIFLLLLISFSSSAQERQYPIIKSYGGIYDVPNATIKPDSSVEYNIVIDVMTGYLAPSEINPSLDNVARLLNLHAVGGVPAKNMHIVLAVHNESVVAIMNNEAYQKRFKMDNPNLELLKQLQEAGVLISVCGQSLIKRNIDPQKLAPNIEIATSMLTTVTTYQLKGYAVLKF
jgi:intracellular sulfur oxidation DsrE/DsrF family protein